MRLLGRLTDGFVRAIPAGGSPAAARLPGAAGPDRVPWIEGFARMSVAWAAWLHEPSNPSHVSWAGRRHDVAALLAHGLAHATDPAHPAWWGPIGDRDQRIVEAAEVATALLLGGPPLREAIDRVDAGASERILDWLALVDGRDVWPDNWVLFPMMSALVRRRAGRPVADAAIDDAVDWMSGHHAGDGWYRDGPGHALDLYTGWAIHWHLLWWATSPDGERRPARRATIVRRARAWLAGSAPMIAADGTYPRFGRSLGYRFAIAAPFVQGALLEIDPLAPGVARRLASGVVAGALDQGAIDPATDWFRVGVGGERPAVVEPYVTPGAAAWAAHAFVALAMPASHAFWSATEGPLPDDGARAGTIAAGRAGLILSWAGRAGGTRLHNARSGHPADVADHDYAATYGKLAYRSGFPCDVPASPGASAGDDDAVVAIDGGERRGAAGSHGQLAHRNHTDRGSAGPGWILARYRLPTAPRPTPIATAVLVLDAGEVRVSAVRPRSDTPVRLREGGAALGYGQGIDIRSGGDAARGTLILGDGRRVVALRALAGYDRVSRTEDAAGPANLVHARSTHASAEELVASTRRRIVATAHVAGPSAEASADGALRFLESIELSAVGDETMEVRAPGLVAALSLAARPPTSLRIAGTTARGPALRIVRASPDGSAFGGERIWSVDGVFALERPGMAAVLRADGSVEATVETGVRLDAGWAGGGLVRLSVRRGAGPFVPIATLTEAGVAPGWLVRRLARSGGTRLVTIRFDVAG
ncbi:MAG: DUF2264 domain-containing protein [Chloroflexota bacterium]|nr:DUF2264 domain-containing protein [Chloroflexota bacterium]